MKRMPPKTREEISKALDNLTKKELMYLYAMLPLGECQDIEHDLLKRLYEFNGENHAKPLQHYTINDAYTDEVG